MSKAKSLTILGVRGLRVHERAPGALNFDLFVKVEAWPVIAEKASVQAMLWQGSYSTGVLSMRRASIAQSNLAAKQVLKWCDVFNRAMKRYEKEQKR